MKVLELKVENGNNSRLDSYLAGILNDISRTYIKKLINQGFVSVNGKKIKAKYIVQEDDVIQIKFPISKEKKIVAENLPIDIIYEDDSIAIINKPKGMVVHPGQGNFTGTLVNALLYHIDELFNVDDYKRPGIVHRLDKETSGLLVVAKDESAYISLIQQFEKREVKRIYMALVHGKIEIDEATIDAPIGRDPRSRKHMTVRIENSKEAISHYRVIEKYRDYTLIEISLETGRMHQIRVHMEYIDHPVVGDTIYCKRRNEFLQKSHLLHAVKLGFIHPKTCKYMEFESELPDEFINVLKILRKRNW